MHETLAITTALLALVLPGPLPPTGDHRNGRDSEPPTRLETPPAATAGDPDSGISMRWSKPSPRPKPGLLAWHELNAGQLQAVETAWVALLRRLQGHRPALFDRQCLDFSTSLEGLDEVALLPVPDPLLDIQLKRLLRHLEAAARACQAHELYNVVYRLEEARQALVQVRWLLEPSLRVLTSGPLTSGPLAPSHEGDTEP